jgi:hypothetical protein
MGLAGTWGSETSHGVIIAPKEAQHHAKSMGVGWSIRSYWDPFPGEERSLLEADEASSMMGDTVW